jgi:hypothetical protein
MIQKNNRFAQSTRRVHHATSLPNRWRSMDSEPYAVVTHSFTRLPCYIALLMDIRSLTALRTLISEYLNGFEGQE